MLKAIKESERICVETGTAVVEWDLLRGGQIVRCDLKGSGETHSLLGDDEAAGKGVA